jgi:hypothetical protein
MLADVGVVVDDVLPLQQMVATYCYSARQNYPLNRGMGVQNLDAE